MVGSELSSRKEATELCRATRRTFGTINLKSKVEIESDAQVLLRMINKEIEVDADLECLTFNIDSLVKHIGDVKIGFMLRGSNLAAHTFASFSGPFVWYEIGSEFLFNILAMTRYALSFYLTLLLWM
ncbi:hypothetical protein DVH24_007222 [Malus domestica]|uniref:RNase H type-1 domain-containing protein n=1 Tax=Malus domestica TaxID=3750 RepID=A0A498HER9_MALDO|nr:hypothetical protein DVH24_007222 [Malus domestica]